MLKDLTQMDQPVRDGDDQSMMIDFHGDAADFFARQGAKSSKQTANASGNFDAANSLRSNAIARVVDLIGEGEIEGIVGGLQGVFFNQTAVQNLDGSFNFQGVEFDSRVGLPDQAELTGFTMAETPYGVSAEVFQEQSPIIRTIADENATAVRVIITIPTLVKQVIKGSNQGSYATSVQFAIDVRANGGGWTEAVNQVISGKCTSPYQSAYRIDLPAGGYPWDVRVRRISPDDRVNVPDVSGFEISSSTVWDSYVEMVEARLTYPHSAVTAIKVNALQFGSSIPSRSYKVRGLKIHIPTNYDPINRSYNGIWDGTFRIAWSNNPAWVLYELLVNERWGLGDFINADRIDTAGLYQIAQYCDQLVDDGKGGKEPRFTFNGVINTVQEAFKVVQSIATAFRGMTFWSVGQVFAVADMPRDPKLLVTPANTIGGFEYAGTALKARHSAVTVAWNNPDDFYGSAIELVRDADAIRQFGWRQADVQAIGCTSRGQAWRYGAWLLDTEQHETETVTYQASFDHEGVSLDDTITGLLPGDLIAIADPSKMRVRAGGRIVAVLNSNTFQLDAPFDAQAGETYVLKVTYGDNTIGNLPISGFSGDKVFTSVNAWVPPQVGSNWIISGSDAAPRQFRVLSKDEVAPNIFKITGLFFDPQKFARVENGQIFDPIPYSRVKNTILPPSNLKATESQYFSEGVQKSRVTLSWTPGEDFLSAGYIITAQGPQGAENYGRVGATVYDVNDVSPGDWTFTVVGISNANKTSPPVSVQITVKGWGALDAAEILNLQVLGGGRTFKGKSCTLTWDYRLPPGVPTYKPNFYVRVYDVDSDTMVRMEEVALPTWTYNFDDNTNDGLATGHGGPRRKFRVTVSALDLLGNEGKAAVIVPENPAPAQIKLNLGALSEFIVFDSDTPDDADLAGYLVWISQTSGFTPQDGGQALDTGFKPAMIPATPGATYYVRAAAYDVFSNRINELNLSNEESVTVTILLFDPFPPSIPNTPALTTAAEVAQDGTVTAVVRASWAQDTSKQFGRYEFAWAQSEPGTAEADKRYVGDIVSKSTWERHGFTPGKLVSVKVRASAANGFSVSGYSGVATITAAANNTPPVQVTNFAVNGGFERAYLSWTPSTSKDVDYVEVWADAGTSAQATPTATATLIAKVAGDSSFYQDPNIATSATRTYWLRPVNTSGIPAASYVGPKTTSSAAISAAQLASGVIDATKLATSITAPTVVSTLPTTKSTQFVTLTTDGKLYRWDAASAKYVSSVPSTDISGQLSDAQLAAISAAKVSGTLTDTQLAGISAAKVSGTLSDSQLAAISASKITGTIVAAQIASAAIDASKLASTLAVPIIVSSLPTTKTSQFVTLSTDGKLYRWDSATSKYVSSVPSTDISGTLSAAQIASVAAASVTGTLTASQIASVAATSVTGTLTDAQIAALAATKITGTISDTQIGGLSASKLTGQLTSSQIGSVAASSVQGTLTSSQIASLDGSKIVGTLLTSDQIAGLAATKVTGQLTSDQIAALAATKVTGQLTSDQIGSLVGSKITGAITAATIDAAKLTGSITTTQITDGAISTPKIATGAIVAGSIAAGAVTASKLTLADTSNLFMNPVFDGGSLDMWLPLSSTGPGTPQVLPSSSALTPDGSPTLYTGYMPYASSAIRDAVGTGYIPVTPGETYYLAADVAQLASAAGTVQLYARRFDGNKANGAPSVGNVFTPTTTWTTYSTTLLIPAGVYFIFVGLRATGAASAAGGVAFTNFKLRKMASAELIVDGSITARKLVIGGTLTSNLLDCGEFMDGLAGWTLQTQDTAQTRYTIINDGSGPTGSPYARLTRASPSDTVQLSILGTDYIPVEPGTQYEYLAWNRGDVASSTGFYLRCLWYTGAKGGTGQSDVLNNGPFATTWTQRGGLITSPANAAFVRLQIYHNTNSVATIGDVASITFKRSVGTTLIADGAITTGKITAGAITAGTIAAGAIVASKLAVASANLAFNADASQDVQGYIVTLDAGHGLSANTLSVAPLAGPDNMPAIQLAGTGSLVAGKRMILYNSTVSAAGVRSPYTVTPGATYEFSAAVAGSDGATARVQFAWYDASNTYITEVNGPTVTLSSATAGSQATRARAYVIAQAPANAAFCYPRAFLVGTAAITNPVLQISALMFGAASPGQAEPSPYVSPGITTLNGSSILAGSISAAQIAAGSIVTSKLAVASKNFIYNADLQNGLGHLSAARNSTSITIDPLVVTSTNSPDGFKAVRQSSLTTTPGAGSLIDITWGSFDASGARTLTYPVTAGATYELSAYLSASACSGVVYLTWSDSSGAKIGASVVGNTITNSGAGPVSGPAATFPRSSVIAVAPAGAVSATILSRMQATGAAAPALYVSGMMFALATAGQTEPSPYVSPGISAIDGSNIITGTISANQIAAQSISASKLLLSDFQNLLMNGDFSKGITEDWTRNNNGNSVVSGSNLPAGAPALQAMLMPKSTAAEISISSGAINFNLDTKLAAGVPTTIGDAFYVEAYIYADVATTFRADVVVQSLDNTFGSYPASVNIAAGVWAKYTFNITNSSRSGRAYLRLTHATNVANTYVTNVRWQRRNAAELLVDGGITANKIQAGAITASKLTLTDLSNFILNPDFLNGSSEGWTLNSDTKILAATDPSVPAGAPGAYVAKCVAATASKDSYYTAFFPAVPGDAYFVEVWVATDAGTTATVSLGLNVRDVGQTTNVWPGIAATPGYAGSGVTASTLTSWTLMRGIVTIPATVAAGKPSTMARFWVSLRGATTPAGNLYFCGAKVRKAASAELLVDGTISARKLVVGGTMTSNLLNVGEFSDGLGGWILSGQDAGATRFTIVNDGTGPTGSPYMRLNRGVTDNTISIFTQGSDYIPVEGGAQYEALAWNRGDMASALGFYIRIYWYSGTKAPLSPSYNDAISNGPIATTWVQRGGTITAPAAAAFARVGFYHHSTSTTAVEDVASVTFKRTVGTTLIADGAITTGKITAGAITAGTIAAGAIVASKLAVASKNFIYNADLRQSLGHLSYVRSSNTWTIDPFVTTTGFSPDGFTAVRISSLTTTPTSGSYVDTTWGSMDAAGNVTNTYPVTGGTIYELSTYISVNNASAMIYVQWLDSAGASLGTRQIANIVNAGAGPNSGPATTFPRGYFVAAAPAGAASARIVCRVQSTGLAAPAAYFSGVMFCQGVAGQTEASPYVSPGVTTIDGGNILTASLSASAIVAGSITAAQIAANTITATQIKAGTITTAEIAAGTIQASNIAAATITGDRLVANTITAAQIAAATITGDRLVASTITAAQLGAGSVSASKLSVASSNLIFNADLGQGTLGWAILSDAGSGLTNWTGAIVPNGGPEGLSAYQATGIGTLSTGRFFVLVQEASAGGTLTNTPVTGGATYEASAYLTGTAGAQGTVEILWWTSAMAGITETYGTPVTLAASQAGTFKTRQRAFVIAAAPANAAFATVRVFLSSGSAVTNPVLSVSGLMLASALAGQTEPSPYVDPGVTTINGSSIFVNSITAAQIAANTITASQIAANTITAAQIASSTITATQIAGRTITAANLVAGTITANEIAGSTITGAKIAGQTITAANLVANTITAGQIAAATITSTQIAANTITASNIAAASITGDRLVANTITASQIAAGAVSTAQLAAGAITADKIGVGLNAGNLIWNSDFAVAGTTQPFSTNGSDQLSDSGLRSDWAVAGLNAAYMHWNGTPTGTLVLQIVAPTPDGLMDGKYPCQAGQRYEFSAYLSTHRLTAFMNMQFFDANGVELGTWSGNSLPTNGAKGAPDPSWRSGGFATAPVGSVAFGLRVLANATGSDVYVFCSAPYVGLAQPNQTQLSPWAIQSRTIISGGQIAANTISATKLIANTVTADKIAVGGIVGDNIAAGAINVSKLAAGTLSAGNITVGSTTLNSWVSGSDSTRINGGSIAANSIQANSLRIGARGVQLINVSFGAERDGNGNINGVFYWTAGSLLYTDDNGNPQGPTIPATRTTIDGGYWYIWWNKATGGNLNIAKDNWVQIYQDPSVILIATVSNMTGISVLVGGTIIDGTRITTGSIQADQIAANAIQARHIAANSISGDRILAGSLAADKIAAGTIFADVIYLRDNTFTLDGSNKMLRIYNSQQNRELVSIGKVGAFYGQDDYGIIIRNGLNEEVFYSAPNRGTWMNGAIIGAATIGSAQIANAQIQNAHIVNLSVDNLKLANQAATQTVTAGAAGTVASLSIYKRSAVSVMQVLAFRRGAGGTQYAVNATTGTLWIEFSTDGSNWSTLDAIPNCFSYIWSDQAKASYVYMLPTVMCLSWSPSYVGVLNFRVRDDNNQGVGGTYISVTELAK